MTVKLGSVDLNNVLTWEEEEEDIIPKKRIVRKTTPTTQSAYFSRMPRMIYLTLRVTATEKASIRALKNQFVWQTLYDYDGITLVDYVWIEHVEPKWRGAVDKNYPWELALTLVCSST